MAGEISFGSLGGDSLQDQFDAALQVGANNSFLTPRTSDSVTTSVVDGSAPIDNSAGGSFSAFWQDTTKALLGYAIAKDAQKNAVTTPTNVAAQAAQQAQAQARKSWMLPLLVVGGGLLVYVVVKKAG